MCAYICSALHVNDDDDDDDEDHEHVCDRMDCDQHDHDHDHDHDDELTEILVAIGYELNEQSVFQFSEWLSLENFLIVTDMPRTGRLDTRATTRPSVVNTALEQSDDTCASLCRF